MTISDIFKRNPELERLNSNLVEEAAPKRAKFLSRPTEYKGKIYDSEWECRHAKELDLRLKAGDIFGWTPQFGVMLYDQTMMWVDFLVVNRDGTCELHECKSDKTQTAVYRLKKKAFKALYPAIKFIEFVKPAWGKRTG